MTHIWWDNLPGKRCRKLYEAALEEIRHESHSPPGSVYDFDDRESATKIATLRYRRETLRRAEEERAKAKPPASSPKLTADENPRVDASSSKLSAKQLRQAISLGSQMASNEAQLMLALKAKQVAELDRRRPHLVWDRDQIAPPQV